MRTSVIHHDIKAHNVILNDHLDAVLADFGSAALVQTDANDTRPPLFKDGLGRGTQGKVFEEIFQPFLLLLFSLFSTRNINSARFLVLLLYRYLFPRMHILLFAHRKRAVRRCSKSCPSVVVYSKGISGKWSKSSNSPIQRLSYPGLCKYFPDNTSGDFESKLTNHHEICSNLHNVIEYKYYICWGYSAASVLEW